MPFMSQRIYPFGTPESAEAEIPPPEIVGGKGVGLAEMSVLGLPVPPGFTISAEVCAAYFAARRALPPGIEEEVESALAALEAAADKRFGDPHAPLLVSVRAGAATSMPGMLDTVLNVGLNDATAAALAAAGGDFAWPSYARLIRSYSEVVVGLDPAQLAPGGDGADESFDTVRDLATAFERGAGEPFPQDPRVQLWGAIRTVLNSWHSRRAVMFRRIHDLPDNPGTAVSVQAMVFGNAGPRSATGVALTRDPATGAPEPFGEYLPDAQGDDVVLGLRTPLPLTVAAADAGGMAGPPLETAMPDVYAQLRQAFRALERHTGAMQDVEFTVERGRLWLLQTRAGVTSAAAALRIAVDMEAEKLLSRSQALGRIDAASLGRMLHPAVREGAPRQVLAKGLPASPGAASGIVALSADEAEAEAARGRAVVLVLAETNPRDVHGIYAAVAVLTSRGGATSHAAIVARSMGRPCVVGAGDIVVNAEDGSFAAAGRIIRRGETVTVDGGTGEVSLGALPLEQPELGGAFATVLGWADEARRLGVRANTSSPQDIDTARKLGAEGIGLFRTEYAFLERESLDVMRQLVLAEDPVQRRAALSDLWPLQRAAYRDVFSRAGGLPVTIRLLDLPLSTFLPETRAEMAAAAKAVRIRVADAKARAQSLSETNPVLGHRGCRLAISWPDLYQVQIGAILQEALAADVMPNILAPVVASAREFELVRLAVVEAAADIGSDERRAPRYALGAMIELPRAVLQAGRIAETADFFSFGTNNLTQTTFGVSRDDAAAFLERYRAAGLFAGDPFSTLDVDGVGSLLRMAVERGRSVQPGLEIGVCGEHGGDPDSIKFFHEIGLDYVSVSPYRIPTARLAAAHVALAGSRL